MPNSLRRKRGWIKIDDLYDIADQNDIPVYCYDLPCTGSLSVMDSNGDCYIGIDPFQISSYAEEKTRLAHELGHCITGSFYNQYATADDRARHEYRANRWAIKKLIPKDELERATKSGITEIYELAEYFNVTVDFLRLALWYYQEVST